MSGSCACFTFVYVQNLPIIHVFAMAKWLVCTSYHPSLTSYGMSCLLIFLYGLLPLWGWALFDCGFFFLQPTILLISAILHFLLWCYLIQACLASSGLLLILLLITQYDHWSFYYMACRLLRPIYFLLDVLDPFTFLGHPQPFLILRPHRFLLTPFGLPRPNYFILHP